jgi:tRNA-binding protein
MTPAPIKPLISTSGLDKIDVRVGTILAVEDVAHSEKLVRCVSISATTRAPFSSA